MLFGFCVNLVTCLFVCIRLFIVFSVQCIYQLTTLVADLGC